MERKEGRITIVSHFCVMVITKDTVDELSLIPILQPWHEFESTGKDDKYVQDVDIIEESRAEFAEHKTRVLKDQNGNIFDFLDDRFYRDPTPKEEKTCHCSGCRDGNWNFQDWGDGRGYRLKIHSTPKGMSEDKVPTRELKTQAEFIKYWYEFEPIKVGQELDISGDHKYGYLRVDDNGEVIEDIDFDGIRIRDIQFRKDFIDKTISRLIDKIGKTKDEFLEIHYVASVSFTQGTEQEYNNVKKDNPISLQDYANLSI